MKRMPKISSETKLTDGFIKVWRFGLQMPSVRDDVSYAAPITRELVICSDSVVVLIYAQDIDSFVFCQEYRMGVVFNKSGDDPFFLQCIAGMIDKNKSPEDTARAEAMEEAGIKVDRLEPMAQVYTSPGRHTEKTHLFLAHVAGAPQPGVFGLPEEGEEIQTRVIPRKKVYEMMDTFEIKDVTTLLALNWFRVRNP